jgi:pyrimidine deaminase RibD-like protein
MSDELKPCAHCGKTEPVEQITLSGGYQQIVCNIMKDGCGAASAGFEDMDEPREYWNTRPIEAELHGEKP